VATEVKLPDLGEGVEGGDVIQVLVAPGDTVTAEQTIAEVETDKAVLEVPCPVGGKVVGVRIRQGDHIKVGQVLLIVDETGGQGGDQPAPREQAAEAAADVQEPKPPAPQTEVAAPQAPAPDRPTPAAAASLAVPPASEEPVPAGPGTRRLARELGVDLQAVARAHPDERITEEHVKAYVKQQMAAGPPTAGTAAPMPAAELPDFSQWGPIERVPFSSLQRKTADHLLLGWHHAPHVTQFDKADVSAIEALRKRHAATEQGQKVHLTVTAFVLKAVAVALKEFPQFNASLDERAGELVYKRYYHIGMAVDTPAGLIVPVLRDVDRKNVLQIAVEMNELAERTRRRKIGLEELRGGTFTVTNLGGLGGTGFTPVINYPEVAILGLARSRLEPVLVDGQWTPRPMMPLCLSYDHRVINGADGVRFIRKLVTLLEDPELLLLGG